MWLTLLPVSSAIPLSVLDSGAWEEFKQLYDARCRDTAENLLFHAFQMFSGITLEERDILEVGCGEGFLSLLVALFSGARRVTALDESAGRGSEAGVLDVLRTSAARFGLDDRLEVVQANAFDHDSPPADIVVANNCLHHFVEGGRDYWSDSRVAEGYKSMFRHLASLLKPGGRLLVQELDTLNLWRMVCPTRVFPGTDWSLHPPLSAWIDAIGNAGFRACRTMTCVPYRLRSWGFLVSNAPARFLMKGTVLITAVRD